MGAFHILQSPFLLLDKKALFLPSLYVFTESSGKSHQTWCQPMGIERGGGQETQRERVIEFTRKGKKREQSDKTGGAGKRHKNEF
ncbi:hypothetical protein QQF64_005662 [Cirrhinus molitorella]|uniref:Uncharacterized protein n=1 Tax=Cirrhinus molitorella TaxID=172907 RepID=A0ABR3MGU8_9TELE